MAKDYYNILEIPRESTALDVENAYKRLAPIYHPNKTLKDLMAAKVKFANLSEAYEVLSDPRKRGIFDMYGEFGLKNGIPGDYSSTIGQYRFNGRPDDIYDRFFSGCGELAREDFYVAEIGSMFRDPFDGVDPVEKSRAENLVV
jgi:DnaJ family protein B protein 4